MFRNRPQQKKRSKEQRRTDQGPQKRNLFKRIIFPENRFRLESVASPKSIFSYAKQFHERANPNTVRQVTPNNPIGQELRKFLRVRKDDDVQIARPFEPERGTDPTFTGTLEAIGALPLSREIAIRVTSKDGVEPRYFLLVEHDNPELFRKVARESIIIKK